MRTATSAAVAVALLAVLLVVELPAPARAQPHLSDCARGAQVDFRYGLPGGWTVRTPIDADGGTSWHRSDDPIARGWRYRSDLRGAGAKDDRLITAPFVATPTTTVTFVHDYVLPGAAEGTVEVTADGGATWQAVPADWLLSGGYDRAGGSGRAFSGAVVDTFLEEPVVTTVDLSDLSGTEIAFAWRLRAPGVTGLSGPGFWAIERVDLSGVADAACVHEGRTELRCTQTSGLWLSGLPDGWSVETPTNESGTSTWTPQPSITFAGGGMATDASGTTAKDDRLQAAPFLATATSRLAFDHRHVLEPGRDGGALEYRVGGTGAWTPVEPHRMSMGAYDATTPDGTPIWTGASVSSEQNPLIEGIRTTTVDLGDLDGEQVEVRWRLLQDGRRPDSLPGVEWRLRSVHLSDVIVDPGCPPSDGDVRSSACNSLAPPGSAGIAGVTDDGREVRLDIRVAMDVAEGGDIALQAQASPDAAAARMAALQDEVGRLLAPMARAYAPLGIGLSFTYDLLAPLGPDGQPRSRPAPGSTAIVESTLSTGPSYADELFTLAREQYDGRRPAGTDVVLVVTDHPLGGSLAGIADCVGGIAHDQHAFAISSLDRHGEDDPEYSAEVAAHEVGHLLGAQHHYMNCAESAPEWAPAADTSGACTLMANDLFFVWLRFSTVNGAIVRGYAVDHASATDG